MMVPMIIRSIEAKRIDLRVQFFNPVVKIVVATRIGIVKVIAGRILPVGLKKRLVRSSEEKTLPMMPK